MYARLKAIAERPAPFAVCTTDLLWTDPHIAKQMLKLHLDPETDLASRRLDFVERSCDWITAQFGVAAGTRIADFGCGPGLYATRLAARGAEVTAIDFSANSLRHAETQARARGLTIDFVHGNYLAFRMPRRFDLILLIYCDFCALSPAQRGVLLEIFAEHLAPGGALLLDVWSLAAYAERGEREIFERRLMEGFWAPEDYFGFLRTFKYDAERIVLDKYTIITERSEFEVFNWLQYFDRDSLEREFAEHGLQMRALFGDVAGETHAEDAPVIAIIAERAA